MNPEDMSGGTGEPGGDQIPEAWIGQEVIILVDHRNKEVFNGPLVEVNDRGVTIRYLEELPAAEEEGEEKGERVRMISFFPWRMVWCISRLEDEA